MAKHFTFDNPKQISGLCSRCEVAEPENTLGIRGTALERTVPHWNIQQLTV